MAENLLNFDIPFDVSVFDSVVEAFYGGNMQVCYLRYFFIKVIFYVGKFFLFFDFFQTANRSFFMLLYVNMSLLGSTLAGSIPTAS